MGGVQDGLTGGAYPDVERNQTAPQRDGSWTVLCALNERLLSLTERLESKLVTVLSQEAQPELARMTPEPVSPIESELNTFRSRLDRLDEIASRIVL